MNPRIETLPPCQFTGIPQHTRPATQAADAPLLWRSFMPRRAEITGTRESALYHIRVYPTGQDLGSMQPDSPFTQWAACAVLPGSPVPDGMETLLLPGGTYAVFLHRGPAATYARTWAFIFHEWLPQSGHRLATLPHFDRLPPGYRPDDPQAEEEIWVPVG